VRKIIISWLVAAAALLGCAGPAFAETWTTGAAGSDAVALNAASALDDASALGRLVAARAQVSVHGFFLGNGNAVSCGTVTACLSVGMTTVTGKSPDFKPTAARWHAGTWTPVPVETPKEASLTVLNGVSCKVTYCLVAGESVIYSAIGFDIRPYMLSWNGTSLTPITPPPVPKADAFGELLDVSCAAPEKCVAIGAGEPRAGHGVVEYVWTLNGTTWGLTAVRFPGAGNFTQYTGLHCFSLTSCVAIGASADPTNQRGETLLAASWNGKRFTDLKAPLPSGMSGAVFTGLSCSAPRSCAAVGTGQSGASGARTVGFAEVWDGKTWAVTKWAGPAGDTEAALTGVSCPVPERCIAVGTHGTDETLAPAALALGGSKWTVLAVPGPGNGTASVFDGVSCPLNGQCVATGETGKVNAFKSAPLAGRWNGRAWTYGPM
jgi:hypothetical protein